MSYRFVISNTPLSVESVAHFAYQHADAYTIEISEETKVRVSRSEKHLHNLLEKRVPIYGVTTGFGDSSFRFVDAAQSAELQANLVSYLNCGTGDILPVQASRASFLIRLQSLSRGYSGVSVELLERMKLFLEKDWIPVTPSEGSLGASGDLVPLAYLAAALQGKSDVHYRGQIVSSESVLRENQIEPYTFKPKEGLALVNGTSTMAGLALLNLSRAEHLLELSEIASAWICLAIQGRTDAFNALINEKAKKHVGQTESAKNISRIIDAEKYVASPIVKGPVQDRYSLRCAPQILGPVRETLALARSWLETEINSVSDNPLIDDDGSLSTGGNFYGGYLGHGMDYLKVSIAQITDMIDRQLMLLMDANQNRGLPPNVAAWNSLPESERFLHHGLKGLHQSASAITSEVMALSIPNTIFSRSSESHNQDKVSLGMSAATQCGRLLEKHYHVQALQLICLAQALDLREIKLEGKTSRALYKLIRSHVPFVEKDRALGKEIQRFIAELKLCASHFASKENA